MSVPQFYYFIDPILRVLADAPGAVHRRELVDAALKRMGLSAEELSELAGWKGKSRNVTKARDRAGWAISYANKGGWVNNAARGRWEITESGRALLAAHPNAMSDDVYTALLAKVREERNARKQSDSIPPPAAAVGPNLDVGGDADSLSPEEQIRVAYARLRDDIAAVLLSNLRAADPGEDGDRVAWRHGIWRRRERLGGDRRFR